MLNSVGRGRECFPGSRLGRGHGHDIAQNHPAEGWFFTDDGAPFTPESERPCKKCGLDPKDYGGHDPCLANLPGVRNACCGHGIEDGYIQFENGVFVQGHFTIFNGPAGKEHDPRAPGMEE